MQRLLKNLTAVAVIGLIAMSGSMAMAKGGGGGGGHSSGGHSGGHSSSGHSMGRSTMHTSPNHFTQSHKFTNNSKNGKNKLASKTGKNKGKVKGKKPGRHHRRPTYHMFYPSGDWIDGDIDDGDADAVEGGIDVEFTSVRQLDAGDPAKNLAPAYRVWFHNNSTVDIDQPFDVAILASTDGQLAQALPYASVRVDGMAADETTSVDIRLPVGAMSMGGSQYSFLHTIVDSQRELVETNKSNNVAVFDRNDIPELEEQAAAE